MDDSMKSLDSPVLLELRQSRRGMDCGLEADVAFTTVDRSFVGKGI